MTNFDIFNPPVSVVAKGLEGKVITIYSSNARGKTKQATKMKKPLYFGFEKGIRAIAGIPFFPINKWSDFKKINKQLCDPKNIEQGKDMYQTIIIDTVGTAAMYCQDFLCKKHGVETIGDGNGGFGLWKEYENEFWNELDKLLGTGYTLVFIAHEEEDKEGKVHPKGDKRSITPIINNSDVVVYLTSNGVDEDNRVIPSSAWFVETEHFFARSRFDYIAPMIPEFTAENLEKAIADAITKQEELEGIQAVSYNEQTTTMTSEVLNFEKLQADTTELLNELASSGEYDVDDLLELVAKHLGKDNKVSEAKPRQVEALSILFDELTDVKNSKK